MSKFLNEGGYGCIYYPGITCDGKPQLTKKIVSKLQRNDESAENEIQMGARITAIPNYQLYFLPVVASCPVRLNKIKPALLTACSNITPRDIEADKDTGTSKGNSNDDDSGSGGYILMEVPYVLNKSFYTILIDMYASKKHVIIGIIENYTYLLEALETLLAANIVHFDIKSDNILYNQQTHLPLILDFGLSMYIPDLQQADALAIYFYNYTPDYYIWPLEVHVINYLLYELEGEGLGEADVKKIAAAYVQHNKGLTNFSAQFHEDYLAACETYLRTYVGKNKKKTIDVLLSFYSSWDNYSLSILYLKTLSLMFPQGFHKNSLILYFSQMLLYNIHPDPAKRYSLADTKQRFKDIFFLEENVDNYVDFINTFDYDPELTTKVIQADMQQLSKTRTKMLKNKKRSVKP
jgi:serine/threonine protein kinase